MSPLLNEAPAIFLGDVAVEEVYLGDVKVWPSKPPVTPIVLTKIASLDTSGTSITAPATGTLILAAFHASGNAGHLDSLTVGGVAATQDEGQNARATVWWLSMPSTSGPVVWSPDSGGAAVQRVVVLWSPEMLTKVFGVHDQPYHGTVSHTLTGSKAGDLIVSAITVHNTGDDNVLAVDLDHMEVVEPHRFTYGWATATADDTVVTGSITPPQTNRSYVEAASVAYRRTP